MTDNLESMETQGLEDFFSCRKRRLKAIYWLLGDGKKAEPIDHFEEYKKMLDNKAYDVDEIMAELNGQEK